MGSVEVFWLLLFVSFLFYSYYTLLIGREEKIFFLRAQELPHVISFDADKNNIQGRVNSYFQGEETESQKAFISRPSSKVRWADSNHTGFPPYHSLNHTDLPVLYSSTPVFFITNP